MNVTLSYPINAEDNADQNRINQVIGNLIDNAIKFTQKEEITIATEIDDKNNQVIVKVKGTGTGIDSDILPNLFGKFDTRSDFGTGLGLYICKGSREAQDEVSRRIILEKYA
jgi:signal transduction histidine kinase